MAEAMVASKSLARRRLRPSQAKSSTTHRLGMDGEADLVGLLLDDLDRDLCGGCDALTGVTGIGEDAFDEGERTARGPHLVLRSLYKEYF
jgi:hypothetical protein